MISLISFSTDHIMPREVALSLGVVFEEILNRRLGYRSDRIELLGDLSHHYKEDTLQADGTYLDKDGVIISSYYLYNKLSLPDCSKDYVYVKRTNHLVDLLSFSLRCEYSYTIEKSVATEATPLANLTYMLDIIEDKLLRLDNAMQSVADNNFNSKCNVHIGGGLLVTFNELTLKEDTCTDELQRELNNGWRIMAVCIQPDQRRPDYVLGRYNPRLDTESKPNADR